MYGRDRLVKLQVKMDELESLGVLAKPEIVDMNIEYLHPSFLIKNPSGAYRLVMAFVDVGRYSKPQLSLLLDVNSTLR